MEETARAPTQIQLRLEVSQGEWEVLEAGEDIFCRLVLTTNRPLKILSHGVKFRSVGVCRRSSGGNWPWRQERVPEVVREEVYARANEVQYHCHNWDPSPPHPEEDTVNDSVTESVQNMRVHVGRPLTRVDTYPLPLKLTIPRNAADNWAFSSRRLSQYTAAISNLVQAQVTYRRMDGVADELSWLDTDGQSDEFRVLRAEQEVRVRNRTAPAERFGQHGDVESSVLSNSWLRGSRGGITCLLTARDQLVVQGQDIPLMVQINNSSSRTLHTVTLEFVQEATLTDPSRENVTVGVDRHTIMAATLPPVAPHSDWRREITHFTAPPNTMNSGSILPCTFATLRFLVLLKVQWTWGSLQCCVEVKVGDRFWCRRHPLKPINLQKYDLQTA